MAVKAARLRESFALLNERGEQLTQEFCLLLAERYPYVIPIFGKAERSCQRKKLLAALALIVRYWESPNTLTRVLGNVGKRHLEQGARPEYYPAIGECLLLALARTTGEAWTGELQVAWSEAYAAASQFVLEGGTLKFCA